MQSDITTILQKVKFLETEYKENGVARIEEKRLDVTRLGIIVSFVSGLVGAGVALVVAFWPR